MHPTPLKTYSTLLELKVFALVGGAALAGVSLHAQVNNLIGAIYIRGFPCLLPLLFFTYKVVVYDDGLKLTQFFWGKFIAYENVSKYRHTSLQPNPLLKKNTLQIWTKDGDFGQIEGGFIGPESLNEIYELLRKNVGE